MKILIISHDAEFTGAPVVCLTLAITLAKLGHDCFLFSPKKSPAFDNQMSKMKIKKAQVADSSYDLYFVSSLMMLPIAHEIRQSGKVAIPIIHEMFEVSPHRDEDWFVPSKWELDQFPFIVCVSDPQALEIHRLMPQLKIYTLKNCCTMDVIGKESVKDLPSKYILYPGKMDGWKGHHELFRNIEHNPIDQDLKFVLLGVENSEIDRLVQQDYVKSKLHGTGPLTPGQALYVIDQCLGLISFSRTETLGMSVLDAVWSDKPVLLSPIAAFLSFSESKTVFYAEDSPSKSKMDFSSFVDMCLYSYFTAAEARENTLIKEDYSFSGYLRRVHVLLTFLHGFIEKSKTASG